MTYEAEIALEEAKIAAAELGFPTELPLEHDLVTVAVLRRSLKMDNADNDFVFDDGSYLLFGDDNDVYAYDP